MKLSDRHPVRNCFKQGKKVKFSLFTPWRRIGGGEV